MNRRHLLLVATFLFAITLAVGCTSNPGPGTATTSPTAQVQSASGTPVSVGTTHFSSAKITTTPDLIAFVAHAAAYARENGREKAVIAFNDPNGTFVSGNVHIFAIEYSGIILADSSEPGIVGTNIQNMTDPFGIPLVQNLAETARFGRGYVSSITRTRKGTMRSRIGSP